MAEQIKLSPEQMRTRAREYGEQANAVNGVISSMDRLLQQLQTEWEGDAAVAYDERYRELRPSFVKAQKLIESISAALTSTANIVEETDRTIAGQFRA